MNWQATEEGELSVQAGDCVAVLDTNCFGNGQAQIYRPRAEEGQRVNYQGKWLQGIIGYCPIEVLEYETPFSLQYSPRTNKVTLTFACWVFNHVGAFLFPSNNCLF